MLQKPVLEKPSTTLGELENSGLLCWWAQRSLSLRATSRTAEVEMKGNWEEIDDFKEMTVSASLLERTKE